MSVTVINTYVRPNTNVAWFQSDATFKAYNKVAYVKPGLRVSSTDQLSADGLTLTRTVVWKDPTSLAQFTSDPQVQTLLYEPRKAYHTANGITMGEASVQA